MYVEAGLVQYDERMASAVQQAADRLGLHYRSKAEGIREQFSELREVPRNATIRNVFSGDLDGRPLLVFQSTYMIFTGQVTVPVMHTVYATASPAWPFTQITPRWFIGRLMMRLGRPASLLLEDARFNHRFKIRTHDDDFAITLLTPEMQTFMLTKTTVRWRLGAGHVCLVYGGKLKPTRMEASLDRLRGFWSNVPVELESW